MKTVRDALDGAGQLFQPGNRSRLIDRPRPPAGGPLYLEEAMPDN